MLKLIEKCDKMSIEVKERDKQERSKTVIKRK